MTIKMNIKRKGAWNHYDLHKLPIFIQDLLTWLYNLIKSNFRNFRALITWNRNPLTFFLFLVCPSIISLIENRFHALCSQICWSGRVKIDNFYALNDYFDFFVFLKFPLTLFGKDREWKYKIPLLWTFWWPIWYWTIHDHTACFI